MLRSAARASLRVRSIPCSSRSIVVSSRSRKPTEHPAAASVRPPQPSIRALHSAFGAASKASGPLSSQPRTSIARNLSKGFALPFILFSVLTAAKFPDSVTAELSMTEPLVHSGESVATALETPCEAPKQGVAVDPSSATAKSAEVKSAETKSEDKKSRLPVLFLSHGGGPCFFMSMAGSPMENFDKNSKACKWFKDALTTLGIPKPKAVLIFSAHWETRGQVLVTSQSKHPGLYYDYGGFPREMYNLKWNAPGSPELAKKVVALLQKAGIKAAEDTKRNLDHGVFNPLGVMFPDADVPVVQASILSSFDPKTHIEMGRAVASLRDEGVLIVGSGFATHNFEGEVSSSKVFAGALKKALEQPQAEREAALIAWEKLPSARAAHAREEHLIPVHVCAGAGGSDACTQIASFSAIHFFLDNYMWK